jgi:hypothetical protein
MRSLIVLAILVGGCATEPAQLAQADCKVAPGTTKGAVGRPGTYSELDRKWAEAKLRNSDVRRDAFATQGLTSPVEQALDDCAKR